MGTSSAQVLLKMVTGFHTVYTLGTKTNFVNFTRHDWWDQEKLPLNKYSPGLRFLHVLSPFDHIWYNMTFWKHPAFHLIFCFNSGILKRSRNVRTANNFLWASYWRHTLQNMSRFEGHPQLILTRKETWKKEQNFWESIPTVRITLETFMIFMIFLQTMQRF